MNKEELSALVAEILAGMGEAPQVKAGPNKPENAGPQERSDGGSAEDVSAIDLRKLYLTENPVSGTEFLKLKARTPARLGMGKAGPRYKTLTQLRFRADHAAAQKYPRTLRESTALYRCRPNARTRKNISPDRILAVVSTKRPKR